MRAEGFGPQLSGALKNTITIELRDAPVRSVFELISKRTGLNFVFDRDVPPDLRTTRVRARHADRGRAAVRPGHQPCSSGGC